MAAVALTADFDSSSEAAEMTTLYDKRFLVSHGDYFNHLRDRSAEKWYEIIIKSQVSFMFS